jgi:hypothetical protein
MPGYPALQREIAEILESGHIDDPKTMYRPIEFIQSIQRYHSIEQRWGK